MVARLSIIRCHVLSMREIADTTSVFRTVSSPLSALVFVLCCSACGTRDHSGLQEYSSGTLKMPQTTTADLDGGTLSPPAADQDIWFQAQTDSGRYLTPMNGAQLAETGPRAADCRAVKFSASRISLNSIPAGTRICVFTNQGRYSEITVVSFVRKPPAEGLDTLTISFRTWSAPRIVPSKGRLSG
jgi:hypothetical protein